MKFEKKDLGLDKGLKNEWIITNGIGGYASSTIIGANTRKYHGLLVSPLSAPGRRYLILSKLDESIILDGRKYDLYTNVCKNYISQGFNYLESFQKEILPVFKYKVEDTEINEKIEELAKQYGSENADSLKENANVRKYMNDKLQQDKTLEVVVNNAIEE